MDARVRADAPAIHQHLRKHKLPEYPKAALDAGFGAVIVAEILISEEGKVSDFSVYPPNDEIPEKYLPLYEELLTAAEKASKSLRYDPYKINGKPSEVAATLVVRFDPATREVSFTPDDANPQLLFRSSPGIARASQNPSPTR